MNYREKSYSTYVSDHTYLYGTVTMEKIKSQFPVWKWYFKKFLPENKEAEILDIGCGHGAFVYFLQRRGFKNVQGIDVSKEQVELAKKLGIENIIQADIKDFLLAKVGIYSVIFARDVIEHFRKDEILDILTIIYSALKVGGIIVIQTPNAESLFGSRYRYWEFTHEVGFAQHSLRAVLIAARFKEVTFYSSGPVPKGIISGIRFFLWKIIELMLRFYILIETGQAKGVLTQNIIAQAVK